MALCVTHAASSRSLLPTYIEVDCFESRLIVQFSKFWSLEKSILGQWRMLGIFRNLPWAHDLAAEGSRGEYCRLHQP